MTLHALSPLATACALSLWLGLPAAAAAAPSTTEYAALCKQLDASRKTRYTGPCEGVLEHEPDKARAPMRYLLTLPDKTEIEVRLYANGVASLNGTPAKRVTSPKGTVRVITGEEEDLLFTDVPDGSL